MANLARFLILVDLCYQVRDRLKKMGHLQPLNIFLRQEIDRMERVIVSVRSALIDLRLAIDGTIIMNEVICLLFLLLLSSGFSHHLGSPEWY